MVVRLWLADCASSHLWRNNTFVFRGFLLQDRVSFACIYLPDAILDNYLTTLAEQAVGEAWLDGLIVTGASTSMGVKLLQNHVDKVGNVLLELLRTRSCNLRTGICNQLLMLCCWNLLFCPRVAFRRLSSLFGYFRYFSGIIGKTFYFVVRFS